jgi:hypothetical protein
VSIFPNVPNVPGVPQLLRNPLAPIALPSLLIADLISISNFGNAQQWGLFLDGNSVIAADNLVVFELKQNWAIADYPIEQGSFETYDKVQQPYDVRLTFSRGGSESDRSEFLASVEDIVNDTNLYDAYTPEGTYINLNVAHYDYKREAKNGVGLLTVNLYLTQVRADVSQQYSTTAAGATGSPANPTATQDPGSQAFKDNGVLPTYPVATLQPPSSAASPGATGIASDLAATAPAAPLTTNVPVVTSLPLMTPANQASGFHFNTAPSLLDGLPAIPSQAATQKTFTLDQFSGGTKVYDPTTATSFVIPAGQAPQALGFH